MSSDCASYHEDLGDKLRRIRSDVENLKTVRGATRADGVNQAMERLKSCRKLLQQFRNDVRSLLDDQAEIDDYDKKSKLHEREIQQLTQQLTALKTLEAGVDEAISSSSYIDPRSKAAARGKVGEIEQLQIRTMDELKKAAEVLQDTQDQAEQGLHQLVKQREVLILIKEDLRTLDGNVQRAKREMNAFVRRMMGDRLVLVMMFIVLIGIITLIVWRIVAMNKTKS